MRTVFTFIALVFLLNTYGQDEKEYQSHWRNADMNTHNMPDDNFGFFKKGNLFYFISNDRDNLYLDIKIEDSGVQFKILQEGLTVWFNADGRQRKETGIRYPIGVKFAKGPGMRSSGSTGSSPLAMAHTIQLNGFQGDAPQMIPAKNDDNFNGSVVYDDEGNLFYTLKMPVDRLSLISSESGAGFEPFTIGIEYGGMPELGKMPSGQAPPQMSDAMPSGGRGGGGGGGRGGRGGAPGGSMGTGPTAPPASTVEVSKIIWIKKVSLADQR